MDTVNGADRTSRRDRGAVNATYRNGIGYRVHQIVSNKRIFHPPNEFRVKRQIHHNSRNMQRPNSRFLVTLTLELVNPTLGLANPTRACRYVPHHVKMRF